MLLVILLLLESGLGAEGLECFHCLNIRNASSCAIIQTCLQNEFCYHSSQPNGLTDIHNLGCTTRQECGSHSTHQTSAIGRSLQLRRHANCHECCSKDNCNKELCDYDTLAVNCQDEPTTDCAMLDSIFHICNDIHHAKLVCRSFCGLCSLVDGQWSSWGEWGDCSVTCGNGTMTRTRTCTNPAPADGGLDCNGSSSDFKPCTKVLCPLHGGWSDWTSWSPCSVSCEVGLSSRRRMCNNPSPARFGDHCFGDPLEYKTCQDRKQCQHHMVYFSVTRPSVIKNGYLVFGQNISNTGSFGENGVFTCPYSGSYFFAVNLVKRRSGSRVDQVHCLLHLGTSNDLLVLVDPTNDATDEGNAMASSTAMVSLHKGDEVYLSSCSDPTTTIEFWSTFTGFLVNIED